MAAPRTAAILVLLLGGGCGGSWSGTFDIGPAATVSVIAWKGKVSLRNGEPGRLEVRIRGDAPVPLDRIAAFVLALQSDGECVPRLQIDQAAKDADLDLEIAAPPGISLSCGCADADVAVSGKWARLEVTTGGAIDARVEAAGSGRLQSRRGSVVFAALGTGPTGELRAESTSGNVSVTLPARWNGQLKFLTQTGKLDVPPHENLRTIWDENKKGVVGRLGPPREKGAPLATVWGTSATGDVSLRLEE